MEHDDKVLSWDELSVKQIRSLLILDDLTVRKILINSIRDADNDIAETEIISAWERIVEKAKEIGINLIGPKKAENLLKVIVQLIIKEFPYK